MQHANGFELPTIFVNGLLIEHYTTEHAVAKCPEQTYERYLELAASSYVRQQGMWHYYSI